MLRLLVVLAVVLQDTKAFLNPRQPRFRVENGNLYIEGARNITIEAMQSVNIQGQDVANFIRMVQRVSPKLESMTQMTYMSSMDDTLSRITLNSMRGRIAQLEETVANNTATLAATRAGPQSTLTMRRLRTVERRVRTIERLLNTNECTSNPCMHGATCEDIYNGFICRCTPGWEGTLCESDVDECVRLAGTGLGCQSGGTCVNTPGSYRCQCGPNHYGVHCAQQTASCSVGNDLCGGNGLCVPAPNNAYACVCNPGWQHDPVTAACTKDIDECSASRPACSHDPPVPCINVPGSFHCGSCPQGYVGNGFYCTDIDECLSNNGGCSVSPSVQCINTRGSSVCGPCPPGYHGDGRICHFLGVCHVDNGGCHPLAQCLNIPGSGQSVTCQCRPGYTGLGIGPSGCFPVGAPVSTGPCAPSPCRNGATCTLSDKSYTCTCVDGFTGRNCETVAPCGSSPCLNGASCTASGDSYSCDCPEGFTGARCENKHEVCGGFLRSEAGSLRFPHNNNSAAYPHGVNCGWVIVTNVTKVLNVTFQSFDLESSTHCSYDWLQIHDGPTSGGQLLGRFCGDKLPKGGQIVSTHNTLYLWFRSDSSIRGGGFQLHWTSVPPVCGGQIEFDSHTSVSSPGSPGKYPPDRDCWWNLAVPPGRRVQLHFFSMQIEEHPDCGYDYLEVLDGSSQDGPRLAQYCNSSQRPSPIVSSGNTLTLHFHSDHDGQDAGFQIAAAAIEGSPGCGGVFTDPSGTVTAPRGNDDDYRPSLDCGWKIQVPLTERIVVEFTGEFDIESGTQCNFDYIEIYDGPDRSSPLVGRYCGEERPPRLVSSSNTVFVYFHSDMSFELKGFTFNYQVFCGGVFTEPQGIITSPYYPGSYPQSRRCVYEIRMPPNTAVSLQFLDFDIEHNSMASECFYDYVRVRDGDNSNSTAIGTYCGVKGNLPDHPLVSTHNYMYIEFVTDASIAERGFKANYSAIDLACGGILKERHGLIESPREGGNYPRDVSCSWLLVAPPGFVVQLTFVSMVLERCRESCDCDYVAVFDNSTTPGSGGQLGKFCGRAVPPVMTSTDSVMNVVFHSDKTVSMEGFTATYTFLDASKVCGARYMAPSGVLRSPNYPNNYPNTKDCTYIIRARAGRQIRLSFNAFDLEQSMNCNWDYVEIRNGGQDRSPLVGKFCGDRAPPTFISVTNEVFIRFHSDSSRGSSGFEILWDSASTGCGGSLNASSGTIHSPNYPEPYGNRAECYWSVAVAQGSVVKAMFTDLDLETSERCLFDFVELWDGMPDVGKQLGRFCSGRPDPVVSRTNHLYVRFHSDAMLGGRGFALDYETSCNTELSGLRGAIESPNWPHGAPRNANCSWIITVPTGNTINVTFSHMSLSIPLAFPFRSFRRPPGTPWRWRLSDGPPFGRLQEIRRQQMEAVDSCDAIFVKILDSTVRPDDDELVPGTELGKFCGTKLPRMVSSMSNKVFVYLNTPSGTSGTGFRLEWVAEGCGGELRRPEGSITSPNYPMAYKANHVCEWTIVADWGKSVELTIWDMNLEHVQNCVFDHLVVYGGSDDSSPELTKLCHTDNTAAVVTSSSRYMFIRFHSDFSYSGRGFNASYKTVDSACGGRLTAPYGSLHSTNYPANYGPADDCVWSIEVAQNHAVQFSLKDLDIDFTANCSSDFLEVREGRGLNGTVLMHVCGNTMPANSTVVSTANVVTVRMKSDGTRFSKGFRADYKTVCGSRIVTGGSGIITSHDAINQNGDNPNCTWTVIAADPSKHVTLTVTKLVVSHLQYGAEESESCAENNHVDIFEGLDDTGVLLGRYCTGHLPPSIVSRGSALHINMVSPYNNFHGWFSASYSVLSSACGGTLQAEQGTIASPGYPDSYPPNSDCEWGITSSVGNKVQLSFPLFNIEDSAGCVDDFVEIRKEHALGTMLGVFCGDTPPSNLTAEHSLWLKFKSNNQGSAPGFTADFALVHGNLDLTGPWGQIASPMYPDMYAQNGEFHWRVTVDPLKVITITVKELNTDRFLECDLVYLEIHDGFDESTPSLLKGCGVQIPDPVTTTSNVVFVHLHNNPVRRATSFLLEWRQVDRQPTTSEITIAGSNCSSLIHIPAGGTANVTSPGFPHGYGNGLNCSWQLDTDPGWHLMLYFHELDLEVQKDCAMDRVEVFTGEGGGPRWKLAYTVCYPNATYNTSLTTSNFMLVNFISDWGINGTGFTATVFSVCGGELPGPSGVIRSPNETLLLPLWYHDGMGSCEWTVTARRGRTLEATFTRLSIRPEAGEGGGPGTCGNSYVLMKNGGSASSPLLGDGKYCGEKTALKIPETSSNQMYVKFNQHEAEASFVLSYSERSSACSGDVRLTEERGEHAYEVISSPNYPNIAPPYAECVWLVLAPPGRRVRLDFIDRFDVSSASAQCKDGGVEVRDGGTELSPLIDTFCTTKPSSVYSTGSMLRVKYYNAEDVPSNGFKANLSVATCGGTLRGATGVIVSPGFPGRYPAMTRCEWRLEVRPTATMTLTFQDLNMSGGRARHCTDSVTVISKAGAMEESANVTDVELGTFCGTTVPANLTSLTNEVAVVFQSNSSGMLPYRGFSLRFTTNNDDCGGTLETASGEIRSPGYPSRTPRQRCAWTIKAPEGRRVSITFKDIDLSSTRYHRYSMQRVILYLGDGSMVFMKSINYTVPSGTSFESTSNVMVVELLSMQATNNRGVRIEFTTDKPSLCGGTLPATMVAPLRPPDGNLTAFLCSWRLDAPTATLEEVARSPTTAVGSTLSVKVARLEGAGRYRHPCSKYSSRIVLQVSDSTPISRLCYAISEPVTILSPYLSNKLMVSRPWYINALDFAIEYRWSRCGGVLDNPSQITSPGFPGPYPNDTSCVWKVNFEDSVVLVTFDTVDLGSACDNFLEVHNGEDSQAPKLGPFCKKHEPLHSSGKSLWIEFHAGSTPQGQGFKITFDPSARACGGILHGTSGFFNSPGFPREYPTNTECIWEVRAVAGYRVKTKFVDRFHIQGTEGGPCGGDHLEVQDWDEQTAAWVTPGRRLCGRTPLTDTDALESSGSRFRFIFRSDGSGSAEGFRASWSVACGFKRTLTGDDASGEIVSPGFPVAYPVSANCSYDLVAPGQVIVARFTNFSVEAGRTCRYDNVTFLGSPNEESQAFGMYVLPRRAVYCDSRRPPPELRAKNRMLFTFQTDKWLQQQGFRMVYAVDSCNQNITKPGEIRSPLVGDEYVPLADCTWNITAPPGHVVRLRAMTFVVEMSYECFSDSLALFDGAAANESALLGRFCGNMSHNLPVVRSTGPRMVARWLTDSSIGNRGFVAHVFFDSAKCGTIHSPQRVYNSTSTFTTIPLTAGGAHFVVNEDPAPPFQDCEWTFSAPPGHNVRLRVGGVAGLQSCPNYTHSRAACECSFVQVADGLTQYGEEIGKFCRARPPPVISSSDRYLWVRMSTGPEGSSAPMSLEAWAEPSLCGVTSLAIDDNTTAITIQSPNYPGQPPPAAHCVWLLDAGSSGATLNITSMSMNGPDRCGSGDSPSEFVRTGRLDIQRGYSGSWSQKDRVKVGKQLGQSLNEFVNLDQSEQTMSFCGRERPPPIVIAPYSSSVRVVYHAGEAGSWTGFQIRVTASRGCPPPLLTDSSGSLIFNSLQMNCVVRITALANQTVTLSIAQHSYVSESPQCNDAALEVLDGGEFSSPLLARLCGSEMSRSLSTSGPTMLVKVRQTDPNSWGQVNALYFTSDQGRGCGGYIHQETGYFSSPMYPGPYRESSVCRWDVEVPGARNPVLIFKVFDLGPNTSCDTDYLEVFDVDVDGRETRRARYCGSETPAMVRGATHRMALKYTVSIRNGGTGWAVEFKGLGSGELIGFQ